MKRPRLNVLRTFEAAGRRQSFSLAADELNISQAAVSQQMRQLETYLDAPLFVRHHRRLTLTGTGQAYLDVVHEALDRLDTVTDQLFPDRPDQVVSLRCTSSVATQWLAPQLGAFQKSHPEIELRIKTLDQDFGGGPSSGDDLEVVILNEKPKDPYVHELLRATITPVCSPKLFAARQKPVKPEDILAFELIHVLGYDDDWHRWFRTHARSEIGVPRGLSVDSSLIAIETAGRGDGVLLGRRPFIEPHLRSGELVEVFAEPFHLHSDYYLRERPRSTGRRSTRLVANWILEMARQESTVEH